jgi:hypothetical protein
MNDTIILAGILLGVVALSCVMAIYGQNNFPLTYSGTYYWYTQQWAPITQPAPVKPQPSQPKPHKPGNPDEPPSGGNTPPPPPNI